MVYQLTDFQYIIYSSFASSGVKEVKVRAEGPKAPEAARPGLGASALSGRMGQNLRKFSYLL